MTNQMFSLMLTRRCYYGLGLGLISEPGAK